MKLLKLKLRNFKGIKSLELVANGHDLNIYGDNATGKTTILDAFMWLLFDKDSQNRSDFAIKTLTKDGEPIHHLDHEVEGTFEIDGETIELKKVYREKWVKKRGSATEEFSGHETDHFIDGVPVKKSEYTQRVGEIAPEDRFKLLTSPLFFNDHMKWQDRRELLIEIAGDVTMEDAIKANPELEELPKILGKRTPDDHKAVIMAKRTEVNRELERIPIRIDEVTKGMPDINSLEGLATLEADLERLAQEKAEKEAELASLMGNGSQGKIRQQIAEIEAQLLTIETEYKRQLNERIAEVESKARDCEDGVRRAQRRLAIATVDLKDNRRDAERLEQQLEELRTKWHEVNGTQLELCIDEACPTCGQALPSEQVEEAKAKAIADFNSKKAQELANINEEGKAKRAELEKTTAKAHELETEITELENTVKLLSKELGDLNKELDKLQAVLEAYKDLDDYKALVVEKEWLQQALEGDQAALTPEIERLREEIALADKAIGILKEQKAMLGMYEQAQLRLNELERQEKALAAEFERLEHELYLIEMYIKTKAELLTDKINSKFRLAEFRLFETQINGGINPICETTYKGVPWGNLNSAGKVQVGLDIIRTLQEHYQFRPPVWIDNRESIVELPEMDCQVISLIVSEKDKTLRVEPAGDAAEQETLFEEAV